MTSSTDNHLDLTAIYLADVIVDAAGRSFTLADAEREDGGPGWLRVRCGDGTWVDLETDGQTATLLDDEGDRPVADGTWSWKGETELAKAYRLGTGCGGLGPADVKRLVELSRANEARS